MIGEHKTKILRLRNIHFFIRRKELSKTGRFSQYILQADIITIMFESMNTDENNVEITNHRSNKDLCLVIGWGMLVLIILGYLGIDLNAQVNTVMIGGISTWSNWHTYYFIYKLQPT